VFQSQRYYVWIIDGRILIEEFMDILKVYEIELQEDKFLQKKDKFIALK